MFLSQIWDVFPCNTYHIWSWKQHVSQLECSWHQSSAQANQREGTELWPRCLSSCWHRLFSFLPSLLPDPPLTFHHPVISECCSVEKNVMRAFFIKAPLLIQSLCSPVLSQLRWNFSFFIMAKRRNILESLRKLTSETVYALENSIAETFQVKKWWKGHTMDQTVSPLPQIQTLKPEPQCEVVWRWVLWEVIRVRWVSRAGLSWWN